MTVSTAALIDDPPAPTVRHAAIGVLAIAQFLVALDFSVVNVALPTIREQLGFSPASVQWVVSAYALAFGGFLLVGGRASDLYGRRRVFVAGTAWFGAASLLGALAPNQYVLVGARAAQGLGAAVLLPSAIALIVVLTAEGPERRRALGQMGAVGSAGAAAGVVLGGVLTQAVGWRSVFWINLPMVAVVLASVPSLVPARSRPRTGQSLGLPGVVTATAGLLALMGALSTLEGRSRHGHLPAVALLALAAILLGAFVRHERRAAAPLVGARLLRREAAGGPSAYAFLLTGTFLPALVLASSYLQSVAGLDATDAGLTFLPMAASMALFSLVLSARLVRAFGVRRCARGAAASMATGLVALSYVAAHRAGAVPVAAALMLLSSGVGVAFPLVLTAASSGVDAGDQGTAAGLINTARQVGAAVGTAALVTMAAASRDFSLAFAIGAATATLASAASTVLFRADAAPMTDTTTRRRT